MSKTIEIYKCIIVWIDRIHQEFGVTMERYTDKEKLVAVVDLSSVAAKDKIHVHVGSQFDWHMNQSGGELFSDFKFKKRQLTSDELAAIEITGKMMHEDYLTTKPKEKIS